MRSWVKDPSQNSTHGHSLRHWRYCFYDRYYELLDSRALCTLWKVNTRKTIASNLGWINLERRVNMLLNLSSKPPFSTFLCKSSPGGSNGLDLHRGPYSLELVSQEAEGPVFCSRDLLSFNVSFSSVKWRGCTRTMFKDLFIIFFTLVSLT